MTATIYNPFADRIKMRALEALAGAIVDNIGPELGSIEAAGNHLLERSTLETDARENALTIVRNTKVVARVLSYLSSIAGPTRLQAQTLNVREVLNGLRPLLSRLLGESITLEIVCDADLWPIKSDLQMFELVILVPSVNARDAMPDGGKLTWSAKNITSAEHDTLNEHAIPPGDYVAIEANDTGCGIPAELIGCIFEPFSSTKPGRGNGTGLSAVYCAIEKMKGYILIESDVGKGTTIRLLVPPTPTATTAALSRSDRPK